MWPRHPCALACFSPCALFPCPQAQAQAHAQALEAQAHAYVQVRQGSVYWLPCALPCVPPFHPVLSSPSAQALGLNYTGCIRPLHPCARACVPSCALFPICLGGGIKLDGVHAARAPLCSGMLYTLRSLPMPAGPGAGPGAGRQHPVAGAIGLGLLPPPPLTRRSLPHLPRRWD
jgi:hypothetical protein